MNATLKVEEKFNTITRIMVICSLLSMFVIIGHGCGNIPGLTLRIDTIVESPESVTHQLSFNARGVMVPLVKPYQDQLKQMTEGAVKAGWELRNEKYEETEYNISVGRAFKASANLDMFQHNLEPGKVGEDRALRLTIVGPPLKSLPDNFQKIATPIMANPVKVPVKPLTWTVTMPGIITTLNNADSVKDNVATWQLSLEDIANGKELYVVSRESGTASSTVYPGTLSQPSSPLSPQIIIIITVLIVVAISVFLLIRFVLPKLRKGKIMVKESEEDYVKKIAEWEKQGYKVGHLKDKLQKPPK